MLLEVREEGGIGEMLEARGVVCHDVHESWEKGRPVAVPVCPLVGASVVAQVRSCAVAGYGSFGYSGNYWGVVAAVC